jgi:hypothetical protein
MMLAKGHANVQIHKYATTSDDRLKPRAMEEKPRNGG